MSFHFWSGEFIEVCELSDKYPPYQIRKIFGHVRLFFEGIASLCLARQTHQPKWRTMGENAVKQMQKMEMVSKWNFENKSKLLQAEHYYTDGKLKSAEVAYKASIVSAQEHKFIHEEALAHELYGIFCVENHMVDRGSKQLHIALVKYKQWGALKKAGDLQLFIDLVDFYSYLLIL